MKAGKSKLWKIKVKKSEYESERKGDGRKSDDGEVKAREGRAAERRERREGKEGRSNSKSKSRHRKVAGTSKVKEREIKGTESNERRVMAV